MNVSIEKPDGNPMRAPTSEWKLDSSGTSLTRPLRGVELMVKHSEHYNDGNFQLTFMASLETALTNEQLKARHEAAWWRTRRLHPIIGISFTLDTAIFTPHPTALAAKQWTTQTSHIATNTTVRDLYLALSRQVLPPACTPTMTLVVDPIRGSRGCVLHISHTLISQGGFDILQEYITQLANPTTELGVKAIFSPENLSNLTPRLPQSISNAYSLLHQPTHQNIETATQVMQRSAARWSGSTIGIPIHPNWKIRSSRMHNKTISFEPHEAVTAFKSLKRLGITLTTAFFACMTSAIAQAYSTGTEVGAHLLFSGNGRRWIDTASRNGLRPVTMPIIPGGMWIDSSDAVNLVARSRRDLVKLAKVIAVAQEEDFASPHIIALLDQNGPEFAKAMGAPQELPAISRPTLTSQGNFSDTLASTPGHDRIRMTDFNTGGRNTDANVCFALNSFRDELRFNLLFDERFFGPDEVVQVGIRVAGLFRYLTGVEEVRARL